MRHRPYETCVASAPGRVRSASTVGQVARRQMSVSLRRGVLLLAAAAVLAIPACGGGRRAGSAARPSAATATGGGSNTTARSSHGAATTARPGAPNSLVSALTAVACRGYRADAQCGIRELKVSTADPNYALFSLSLQFGPGGAPVGAALVAHHAGGQWTIVWGPGTGGIGCFGAPIPAAVLAGWSLRCPTAASG